eukprot:jgi/Tetstr1/457297/TSEL_043902.t1
MRDATQAQLDFMATELPRFEAIGAWERGHCNKWVSRMFLVPKPGTNKWRLIIDLRELNKWCKTFTMSYETLKHLRHLARAGDWFVSMDLADGYYALGIREEDRDFFTVNYRGELWRLACLPMGWTGSSYYFCKLTAAFTDYLRTPLKRRDPALPPTAPSKPTRRFLRNTRWRGERLLPYMDDFLFLADSREAALELRVRLSTLLDRLGLLRNPNKGVWEPTQVGPHLGLIIDLKRGEFRAPEEKLIALAKAARSLLGRAASNKRWLPVDSLHLPDELWRREHNYCNPPWGLLDDLADKLRQSGAAATVIAPHWPGRRWYQLLQDLATETIVYPPTRDLFFPGRRGTRAGVGLPGWSVVAFRLPRRHGCTSAVGR